MEKVIQFGEGGFLRGFVDWMLQKMKNEGLFDGEVVVVQPIEKGLSDMLEAQGCNYNHLIRGKEGEELLPVSIISRTVKPYDDFENYLSLAETPDFRFIVSNTTEAGIVFNPSEKEEDAPNISFPAKLLLLLKRRFEKGLSGFIFLPCELIDRNGDNLKKCLLSYAEIWGYSEEFKNWLKGENIFTNTLVDRINTGFSEEAKEKYAPEDNLINTSDYFHLWVIETEHNLFKELPFDKAGLNVIVTKNELEKYRTRKVRILNGAHTSLVCHGILSGIETVGEALDTPELYDYLKGCIFEEIIPTLDMPKDELLSYASDVITRFQNPFIHHKLRSIALNSVSKFKVRVLPSILRYKEIYGVYPERLCFSLWRLIEFYKTDKPDDEAQVIEFIKTHSVEEILANIDFWGTDLTELSGEVLKYADR